MTYVNIHSNGMKVLERRIQRLHDEAARRIAHQLAAEIAARWSANSPSDAGDPPAIDSGALAESITITEDGAGGYIIGSALPYAATLEFGGEDIAPRPWLRPATAAIRAELASILASLWAQSEQID